MGKGGAKNTGPMLEDVEEEFPFPLTDVDRHNLSISDSDFRTHTWDELKQIIGRDISVPLPVKKTANYHVAENRLETLRRWPSDLKRYIKWSAATKKEYGSIMVYVMQKRLKWTLSSRSTPETGPIFDCEDPIPFSNRNDYRVMPNDWPYGLEKGISHLIVWLKNRLEVEPPRGDMTSDARHLVEDFIQKEFVQPVTQLTGGEDNVIWFKNWVALQSVPGIDHVHVLVRNVPQNFIDERWTKGQRPVQDMVRA